ncbi:S-layer protein [archaeon]|nr:S-layer protein [archaeon]
MKSINIKKVATIAAGAVMLAGAAFAAVNVPTEAADPGFYWDDNGNVISQVVLGSQAQAVDGVQAAKFAAFLGSKAYVTGDAGGEGTVLGEDVDLTCAVTVETEGGQIELPEESVKTDIAYTGGLTSANRLTLQTSEGMQKGYVKYKSTEYDYEEKVVAGDNTIGLGYVEGNDYHGVHFSNLRGTGASGKYYYRFDFLDNFPIESLTDTVTIPFLGEDYVINKVKTNEIELVKGTKIDLGVGQQQDVTVGNTTYTVTLKDVGFDEGTSTGYAFVEVVKGSDSSTIKLDKGDSAAVLGLTVYVQAAAKSYATGTQGTATLRVGGEALKLKSGYAYPNDADWEVKITTSTTGQCYTTGSCSTYIDYISLYYDKNVKAKDGVISVAGPEDYFWLEYMGTQVDQGWNTWEYEDLWVGAGIESSDAYPDYIRYTDYSNNRDFAVNLNDGTDQLAFLASTAAGFIGNWTNATVNTPLALTEGDLFFVNNAPVYVSAINMASTLADAQMTLEENYGIVDSTATSRDVKANGGTNYAATGWYLSSPTLVGSTVELNWTYNGSIHSTPYVRVLSGASNTIRTKYGYIDWTHMDNASTEILGPTNVLVTTPASSTLTFGYDNASTNEGYWLSDGSTNVSKQNTANTDYESYLYHKAADYSAEADEDETTTRVKITLPEQQPLKHRVTLTRTGIAATEAGQSTYTYPDFSGAVVDMTCEAADVVYDLPPTGVSFGTVGMDIVILDTDQPRGNALILGGHAVNAKAVGATEEALTAAGSTHVSKEGTNVFVAGWAGTDTKSAIDALIDAIKVAMVAEPVEEA